MRRNGYERIEPRSWYWSAKTKWLVGVGIVVAFLVISALLHPGGGGDHPPFPKP